MIVAMPYRTGTVLSVTVRLMYRMVGVPYSYGVWTYGELVMPRDGRDFPFFLYILYVFDLLNIIIKDPIRYG